MATTPQPPKMSRPQPPPSATPQQQALIQAYDSVLREQEAKQAEEVAPRRKGRWHPLTLICGTILLVTWAYLWVERPQWVFSESVPAESAELREASLRLAIANVAQHVERFRARQGRLPVSLDELGLSERNIGYSPAQDRFTLSGSSGPISVTFSSTDSLPTFIGNSFEVIARRAAP